MSESSTEREASTFQRIKVPIILIAVLVVVTGFVYAGGYFLLPGTIRSAYQDRDCEKVLSREGLFTRLYPGMITDEDTSGLVRECAVYSLATRNEETGMWRDSYNAYRVYAETYPQGLFAGDAHEHAAVVLINLAKEEMSREKYSEAAGNLDSLLEGYADTAAASGAGLLSADLQMEQGIDLRESGDFSGAEQVLKQVNVWAQEDGETEYARLSQLELSQTYLAWGQTLQEQGRFAEAKMKFDDAVSTDPDPSSPTGPAVQAAAGQVGLFTRWGDQLIQQKDFASAMDLYETAGALSGDGGSSGNDIVAHGYLQWAEEAVAGEDFLGALVLLDFAQERAATDSTRTSVEEARSDLYLAFSQSNGEQTKKAMANAVRTVCVHHTQPRLPIFGLDQENIWAGVHGTDQQLPEPIAATTPGSLHYAACIEEDTRLVGSLTLPISNTQFGGPPGVIQITYGNYQYIWNVVLRRSDSGDEVGNTVIEGVEPAALIPFNINITTFSYFGSKPHIEDLADWILSEIE